jgi:SAM-dependent methyltransferase
MLPDALTDHWAALKDHFAHAPPELSRHLSQMGFSFSDARVPDSRTRASFTHEWRYYEIGGRTWGMELDHRVKTFFLEPLRIPPSELRGKLVLDAGCGNGSQSVAYTEFGVEVIAVDLTTGVEKSHAFRHLHGKAVPEKVHFIQGDLQRPPLAL